MSTNGNHPPVFTSKASLQLNFVVVGAGLSGLSCALNLAYAGHRVRVLEKLHSVGKSKGGIRLTPNLTRLLCKWGLGPRLEILCQKCTGLQFYDGSNAELIGGLNFPEQLWEDLQSPMLSIPYSDLHNIILALVQEADIQIDFDAEVVEVDPSRPCVTLSTGKKIEADIIVGADGGFSVVRQSIINDIDDYRPGIFTVYTLVIAENRLTQDEDLLKFTQSGDWALWTNSGHFILTYRLNNNHDLCVTVFLENSESSSAWTTWADDEPISLATVMDLSLWDPMIQRLLLLCESVAKISHVRRPRPECWYHTSGNVILIGEAVHTQAPSGISTASIMIEDGVVLASLFSHLRERSQIQPFFSAFQEIREDRALSAMEDEISKTTFCLMPPGPERDGRNAGLRRAMDQNADICDESQEERIRVELDQWRTLFFYDAYEEAEGWWLQWGLTKDRHSAKNEVQFSAPTMTVSCSIEIEH